MNFRRIIWVSFLILLLAIAWLFFVPRNYNVQAFEERTGTEYWELSTGSRIGYTKIESITNLKKPPIIYLHGGPGGRVNDETIKAMRPLSEQGHDLYFYDQIGSGNSLRLDDISEYTVGRHKADLEEIIDKISSGKVILIGHSWGCLLAINYIEDHPDKVEKMILEGPGPILPINKTLSSLLPPDSLNLQQPAFTNEEGNKKANNLRSLLIKKWAYLFNRKLASDKEADDFFAYLNQELSKSTFCKAVPEQKLSGGGGYYAHIMTVKSFDDVEDKREKLAEANMPVLILRGQCDNQKWGYTQEYLNLLSNSRLVIIENTGHDLIAGNKEKYFELVNNFLHMPEDTD